eukprot:ANDGO_07709.mRNA.1 hypothetical protein
MMEQAYYEPLVQLLRKSEDLVLDSEGTERPKVALALIPENAVPEASIVEALARAVEKMQQDDRLGMSDDSGVRSSLSVGALSFTESIQILCGEACGAGHAVLSRCTSVFQRTALLNAVRSSLELEFRSMFRLQEDQLFCMYASSSLDLLKSIVLSSVRKPCQRKLRIIYHSETDGSLMPISSLKFLASLFDEVTPVPLNLCDVSIEDGLLVDTAEEACIVYASLDEAILLQRTAEFLRFANVCEAKRIPFILDNALSAMQILMLQNDKVLSDLVFKSAGIMIDFRSLFGISGCSACFCFSNLLQESRLRSLDDAEIALGPLLSLICALLHVGRKGLAITFENSQRVVSSFAAAAAECGTLAIVSHLSPLFVSFRCPCEAYPECTSLDTWDFHENVYMELCNRFPAGHCPFSFCDGTFRITANAVRSFSNSVQHEDLLKALWEVVYRLRLQQSLRMAAAESFPTFVHYHKKHRNRSAIASFSFIPKELNFSSDLLGWEEELFTANERLLGFLQAQSLPGFSFMLLLPGRARSSSSSPSPVSPRQLTPFVGNQSSPRRFANLSDMELPSIGVHLAFNFPAELPSSNDLSFASLPQLCVHLLSDLERCIKSSVAEVEKTVVPIIQEELEEELRSSIASAQAELESEKPSIIRQFPIFGRLVNYVLPVDQRNVGMQFDIGKRKLEDIHREAKK